MWRWPRRRDNDHDLEEELKAHLAIETQQRIEAGDAPADAADAAKRAFGSFAKTQEATRETWGWAAIERFLDDMGHGIRVLKKTPRWTGVIVAILALGIGLTTAIFSVMYGVLLAPLPYPEPERLMTIWSAAPKFGMPSFNVSAANWRDWRAQMQGFEDIAITRAVANFNLTGSGIPERLQGARTSWNLTQVLGVKPLAGRVFTEQEQLQGANVAVLSYGLWERRFGRDQALIGKTIQLNGTPFEVIGIMPPEYRYPSREFELWTPLYIRDEEYRARLGYEYLAVARLKRGITLAQIQAEFATVVKRIAEQYPALIRPSATVKPMMDSTVEQVRATIYVLFAAVGCLLLIACVNVGNLLLARAIARAREMALRTALGATGGRLQRQMLAEVLPLSIAGALGGLLFASWLLKAMLPMLPSEMPRVETIGLNGIAVLFALALSVLVVLIAGMLPARFAARTDLAESLKQDSRTVAGGSGLRNALVIGQIAVTLGLLFAGGLLARSLQSVLQIQPGFGLRGVLTMHLAVTRAKYGTDPQVAEFCRRVLDRVKTVPGVTAVGMVNRLPLSGHEQTGPLQFEGKPESDHLNLDWRSATPDYFGAIGIPLLRGRFFTDADTEKAAPVAVIDERVASEVFGTADPIGKRFRISLGGFQGPWVEIIGVVGHIRSQSLERDERPQVYWPHRQRTQDRMVLVARTAGHPESFTSGVVEQIHKEDSDQPVYDVRSMESWLDRTLQHRRLLTGMVGVFSFASLLLACLGLYGAVSYSTGLRLREFGIRMALGADAANVRRLVLRQAGKLALLGSIIGFAFAWPVGIALRSFLFQIGRFDPAALIVSSIVLLAVALLASWGPARRAARLDPAVVLRAD